MKVNLHALVALSCLAAFPACTLLGWSPDTTPAVQIDTDRTTAIAATAMRRMAYINRETGQVVAEPPPDAAQAISQTLSLALSGKVTGKGELSAQALNEISRKISRLGGRAQGVLFFRDTAFHLGQAWLNESLAEERMERGMAEELISSARDLEDGLGNVRVAMADVSGRVPTAVVDRLEERQARLHELRMEAEDAYPFLPMEFAWRYEKERFLAGIALREARELRGVNLVEPDYKVEAVVRAQQGVDMARAEVIKARAEIFKDRGRSAAGVKAAVPPRPPAPPEPVDRTDAKAQADALAIAREKAQAKTLDLAGARFEARATAIALAEPIADAIDQAGEKVHVVLKEAAVNAPVPCKQKVSKDWYDRFGKAMELSARLIEMELKVNNKISTPPEPGADGGIKARFASTPSEAAANEDFTAYYFDPDQSKGSGVTLTLDALGSTKSISGTFGDGGLATITVPKDDIGTKARMLVLRHPDSLPHYLWVKPAK